MGTGAVFGLTSALVGETLPGSGPAIATGNALAEGPVIFYWPQQVIDELERQAKIGGGGEWFQLRVDLFRQAPAQCRAQIGSNHQFIPLIEWLCEISKGAFWKSAENKSTSRVQLFVRPCRKSHCAMQ